MASNTDGDDSKRGVLVEIPKVGHMPQVEVFDTYIKYLVDNLK